MTKRLFKVRFIKPECREQDFFERSIPWTSVTLLLIICDHVKVVYKKNRNKITFIFHKRNVNTYCQVLNVPDYLAKTILKMEQWRQL